MNAKDQPTCSTQTSLQRAVPPPVLQPRGSLSEGPAAKAIKGIPGFLWIFQSTLFPYLLITPGKNNWMSFP